VGGGHGGSITAGGNGGKGAYRRTGHKRAPLASRRDGERLEVPTAEVKAVPIAADYPFLDVFWTMILFFLWVAWIWTLISVLGDVFRRHDISGWGKAGWTLFLIVVPFLGVLIYLIAHGKEMAERNVDESNAARAELDDYVKSVADSGGAASEIDKAKRLLDGGAITQAEFDDLKRKALAS